MEASDILIVGAGPTGMALGVALGMKGRRPAIVDARPAGAAASDKRILALSHGSHQILQRLGAWEHIRATPIRSIHVSQQGGFGRTLLHATDYGVDALGHVASAASVAEALAGRLDELGLEVRHQCTVTNLAAGAADVLVSHDCGGAGATLGAKLVALAEGAIAQEQETQVVTRDYGQHAVICTATPVQPHGGTAFERFTPHGPLALLPFGRDYAVVLTVPADESDALLALDDTAFLARLQSAIGSRATLASVGPRARYPLLLRYRRHPVGQRTAWIGNAAQTLHPVAGQGFNLALRDVWDLAETVAFDPQADPGATQVLARYARARRLDRHGVIGFTDTLIRVFSNDIGPVRIARGGGLAALDLVPPLKHFVAKRMMFGARAWP